MGRFSRATQPLRLPHLPLRLLFSQEHIYMIDDQTSAAYFHDDRSWKKATTILSSHFHFHDDRSLSSNTLQVNPNTLLASAEPKRLNRSLISFYRSLLGLQGAYEIV